MPPLPKGWRTVQQSDGTAGYQNSTTGHVQSTHPVVGGKGASGYGVRSGEWKGVVPHCAVDSKPSRQDKMQVYHLPSDPFETTDVASTAEGKKAAAQMIELVLADGVSCACFQC